jgi:hypothetical protein
MIATRTATSHGSIVLRHREIIAMCAVTVRRVIIVMRAARARRAMLAAIVGRRRVKPRVTRRRATIATRGAMSRVLIRVIARHREILAMRAVTVRRVIIVTRAGTARRPMLVTIVGRRRAITATAGSTTATIRHGLTDAGPLAKTAVRCCANMSATRAGRARSNASLAATRPVARRRTATAIPTTVPTAVS